MLVVKGGLRLQFQIEDTVEQTLRRFAADLGLTYEQLLDTPVRKLLVIPKSSETDLRFN